MSVPLDRVTIGEDVKTFQEATSVNASQDSWAMTVKSVHILHS